MDRFYAGSPPKHRGEVAKAAAAAAAPAADRAVVTAAAAPAAAAPAAAAAAAAPAPAADRASWSKHKQMLPLNRSAHPLNIVFEFVGNQRIGDFYHCNVRVV